MKIRRRAVLPDNPPFFFTGKNFGFPKHAGPVPRESAGPSLYREKSPCSGIGRDVLHSCRSGLGHGGTSSARPGCQGVSEEGTPPSATGGNPHPPAGSRTPSGHRVTASCQKGGYPLSQWGRWGDTPPPDPVTPAFLRIRPWVTDQRGQKRAVPQVPVHGGYRLMFRSPPGDNKSG